MKMLVDFGRRRRRRECDVITSLGGLLIKCTALRCRRGRRRRRTRTIRGGCWVMDVARVFMHTKNLHDFLSPTDELFM